jgi:hypothetical protein
MCFELTGTKFHGSPLHGDGYFRGRGRGTKNFDEGTP